MRGDGSLFVSAGEVSGDHYIARVVAALREKGFDAPIYGLCGAESRAAGVDCRWRSERLHLIGVSEVLSALPGLLSLKREIQEDVVRRRPSVLLLADSPDFHMPLVRALRRDGYRGRVLYISPPSVWAWRSYRVRELALHFDECLPLFRFEHDFLRASRCASLWQGHPLVEDFSHFVPDRGAVLGGIRNAKAGFDPEKIVALLPGSRRGEIEQLCPILEAVYRSLDGAGCSPVFSVAPGLSDRTEGFLKGRLQAEGLRYYEGPGRNLMEVSRVAAGSSGTATAEALLLGRYMVVMYRLRPLSALIGKMFLRHLFFAIPNLLAKEMFYPELIQEAATAAAVERELMAWLRDEAERKKKEKKMKELVERMGRPGAYDFWATRVLEALS